MRLKFILAPFSLFIIIFSSCHKETYYTSSSAKLSFSTDTVMFDTVFSTIGSATKRLMVHNPYDKAIKISKIYVGKGSASNFKLNIDGLASNETTDVEIAAKDSMYIFVEVTVDPTGSNSPVIIDDSVVFVTNGEVQKVTLEAYGQDVHLYKDSTIQSTVWTADKPYLIYDYLLVDSLQTLTIEAGAVIYMHHDASFIVHGSLVANGTLDKHIVFRGDRLEELYKDLNGQWGYIAMVNGSTNNILNYVEIKNATAGIQIGEYSDNLNSTLELSNCLIQNMSFAGIYAFGATITAYNTIIDDCAYYALGVFRGGSYHFVHSTISNSTSSSKNYPSVLLSNNYGTSYPGSLENAYFGNCIIYGSLDNEIGFINTGGTFNYLFDHCLIKVKPSADTSYFQGINITDTTYFKNLIKNKDPKFLYPDTFNFQLDSLSPAINEGLLEIATPYPLDYNGTNRLLNDGLPDLGAFERKK
jgi:hypothetical protein